MTLQPLGSAGHDRAGLTPLCPVERGQLLRQTLGGCQSHWNGMGLVARIRQRCPSPAFPGSPRLSLLRVEAGEEQLPTAALLALMPAEALGSGRAAAPGGQQPPATASGTACSTAWLRAFFSLSHGKAHRTRRPGELGAVSFLAGSVGKTRESGGGCASPSQGGRVSGASRGECVGHSTGQEEAACPLTAPLRARGTEGHPPPASRGQPSATRIAFWRLNSRAGCPASPPGPRLQQAGG